MVSQMRTDRHTHTSHNRYRFTMCVYTNMQIKISQKSDKSCVLLKNKKLLHCVVCLLLRVQT